VSWTVAVVAETVAVRMYYIVAPASGKVMILPNTLMEFVLGDILNHVVKGITARPVVPAGKTVVGDAKFMVKV
jgi:hypothetical protein